MLVGWKEHNLVRFKNFKHFFFFKLNATTKEYLTLLFTAMMASVSYSGFQNIPKSDHIVIPKIYLYGNLTNYEAHYPHHFITCMVSWITRKCLFGRFLMPNKLKIECNLKCGFLNAEFLM